MWEGLAGWGNLSVRGWIHMGSQPSRSLVLLTGLMFPGTGGRMLGVLEITTPLPWGRGVAVWCSGLGRCLPMHLESDTQEFRSTHQLHGSLGLWQGLLKPA